MGNHDKYYEENQEGTVVEPDADLMWAKRDSRQELGKWLNWDEAIAYAEACNGQKYLGFNDWRLPTKSELRSILKRREAFRDIFLNLPEKPKRSVANYQAGGEWSYWSSETRYDSFAWKCYFPSGKEICVDQQVSTTGTSVRLVRDS